MILSLTSVIFINMDLFGEAFQVSIVTDDSPKILSLFH